MFTALCFGNNITLDAARNLGRTDYTTAEEAKKGGAGLIIHSSYKQYFTNGYDIIILDMDAGKVVSRAKTEIKTLEWKDAA